MRSLYKSIYLSPHLDDAALSCGGNICRQTQDGAAVLLVTVLAGDPPTTGLSPMALSMQHQWQLMQDAGRKRRAEDIAACKILGADYQHWPHQEAIYRTVATHHIYPDLAALFGAVAAADQPFITALAAQMRLLPPAERVYLPLGAGGHVDHQIVRQAGEQAFAQEQIYYYEDFPYAQRFRAVRRLTEPRRRWRSELVTLAPTEINARLAAIAAYPSQSWVIFKDPDDLDFKLHRYLRRVGGGERCWQLA